MFPGSRHGAPETPLNLGHCLGTWGLADLGVDLAVGSHINSETLIFSLVM